MSFPLPGANWTYLHTLTLKASTGLAGFALVNGTPGVLSWTAPNDGKLHRVFVLGDLNVTVNETGGQLLMGYTDPTGTAQTHTLDNGNEVVGLSNFGVTVRTIAPGGLVTVSQGTALTAGAATMWAEIWAL